MKKYININIYILSIVHVSDFVKKENMGKKNIERDIYKNIYLGLFEVQTGTEPRLIR